MIPRAMRVLINPQGLLYYNLYFGCIAILKAFKIFQNSFDSMVH
jgi:hypothetical protein